MTDHVEIEATVRLAGSSEWVPFGHPNWVPVDLEKSDLSELIELRSENQMKRHLHPGAMLAQVGDHKVYVPSGVTMYVNEHVRPGRRDQG